MNSKKAKRLRQLVRHLQDKGVVEKKDWIDYGREQKFVEMLVPDDKAETVFDENGKLIMATKKQLVATGSRMMDPDCGRSIYQQMKGRAERNGK